MLASAGHVVEKHRSAEDFLSLYDPDECGCDIIDLRLPGLDGFGIQKALGSMNATRPIIFLTGAGDIPSSVRAIKAGAVDFLTKPVDGSALLAAIDQALEQDAKTRQMSAERRSIEDRMKSLTPREREVMDHVVAGQLNKQIAGDLGIVEKTIKVHRGRMMTKMGVRTVADLVRLVSTAAQHY